MNFGLNQMGGGLSLVRILGSISRTLGMVRQVAPIYQGIKPLITKAPEFFARLNNMRNVLQNSTSAFRMPERKVINQYQNDNASFNQNNVNGPVFFQ